LNLYRQKARDSVVAAALTALLIAVLAKLALWLPSVDQKRSLEPSAATQPQEPRRSSWPGVEYREVRAYYSPEPFISLDHAEHKDGILLDAAQERRLISAVTARVKPYPVIDLWVPQHAFVFYDSSGKPVAEVDIGFHAFTVGPSAPGYGYPDIVALADLVVDLGLPLGVDKDSAEFRKRLKRCQEGDC
jgi:hypothetical protein